MKLFDRNSLAWYSRISNRVRHAVAIKVESLFKEIFAQLYPLSNAARLLLASEFSQIDENQSDCKRVAYSVRVAAVLKIIDTGPKPQSNRPTKRGLQRVSGAPAGA